MVVCFDHSCVCGYKSHSETVPVNVLQADNQLFGAYRTAMLFVTPAAKKDIAENTHALCISAHKIPNMGWNAEIFKVETLEYLNNFQLILKLCI